MIYQIINIAAGFARSFLFFISLHFVSYYGIVSHTSKHCNVYTWYLLYMSASKHWIMNIFIHRYRYISMRKCELCECVLIFSRWNELIFNFSIENVVKGWFNVFVHKKNPYNNDNIWNGKPLILHTAFRRRDVYRCGKNTEKRTWGVRVWSREWYSELTMKKSYGNIWRKKSKGGNPHTQTNKQTHIKFVNVAHPVRLNSTDPQTS